MVEYINLNKRVMIVDDEPDILISLKTVLECQNYDVITVSNGSDCLKEIEKGFKGVILIDIMMPLLDGWETINQISKKGYTKDVAIEIITGKGTKNYQKLNKLGSYIYDYLVKPLDMKQLIKSVEECNKYFNSKKS
jgi:DNA-binding response OmpR family regulator